MKKLLFLFAAVLFTSCCATQNSANCGASTNYYIDKWGKHVIYNEAVSYDSLMKSEK